ncbi:MAG: hypothetical protein ACYTFI_11375, partial [Planctomycetota bacterium]
MKVYSIEAPAKRNDREWMARFTAAATFEERRELLKQKPASLYHAWNATKNTKIAAAALAVMALGAFGFALKRRGQHVVPVGSPTAPSHAQPPGAGGRGQAERRRGPRDGIGT